MIKQYDVHGFMSGRLRKDESEYIDVFGDRTDKFGWVWWIWFPRLKIWKQDYRGHRGLNYYIAHRITFCWLFFGFQIEMRLYSEA